MADNEFSPADLIDCPYEIERANLYMVRRQISRYLCNINTRIITTSGDVCVYTYTEVDYTVQHRREVVLVGSHVGEITITLPATPELHDYAGVWDAGNSANLNNITIARNGGTIVKRTENCVIDRRGGRFDFITEDPTDPPNWELAYVLGCEEEPPPPAGMIITLRLPDPSTSVTLTLTETVTYNFTIDWGDGQVDTITTWDDPLLTHIYAEAGDFDVEINGSCPHFRWRSFPNYNYPLYVKQWGDVGITSLESSFYRCSNLSIIATDVPNLSACTDMSFAFNDCDGLTTTDGFEAWDVSNITSMFSCFGGSNNFNGDLSSWQVGNVTDFSSMFAFATSFNSDLSAWDTSSATTMEAMFAQAWVFNQSVQNWDTSNVTTMEFMFNEAFAYNQDMVGWDVSSCTNFALMFGNTNAFNGSLANWTFNNAGSFITRTMFFNASVFNGSLAGWNVTGVTDTEEMFSAATVFNQPIGGWDVSAVTDFSDMFRFAEQFDQDVSSWNVTSGTTFTDMFRSAIAFSTANYDLLLNGWSQQVLQSNKSIRFESQYTIATSQAARDIITGTYGWTITDGGGV